MTTDCKYHVDKMGNINIIYGEKNSRFPFCNTIFIDDEIKAVIDPAAGIDKLKRITGGNIDWVINSHFHFDHIAFNYLFEDADIYTHEMDKEALTSIYKFAQKYGAGNVFGDSWIIDLEEKLDSKNTHKHLNSFTFNMDLYRSIGSVDYTYTDRDIFRFGKEIAEVIHTPGHADSMCCFLFPRHSLLYVSDYNVLTDWGPWYGGDDSDIEMLLKSEERLKAVDAKFFLSAHDQKILTRNEFVTHLETFNSFIFERNTTIRNYVNEGMEFNELCDVGIFYKRKYFYIDWVKIWETVMLIKHLKWMNMDFLIPES